MYGKTLYELLRRFPFFNSQQTFTKKVKNDVINKFHLWSCAFKVKGAKL